MLVYRFQQFLILGFTVPAVAALQSNEPLGVLDAVAAGLFLLFVAGEAVADHQQFVFQTEKYRLKGEGRSLSGTPYEQGFIDTGLWALSRHPNYFCEVMMGKLLSSLFPPHGPLIHFSWRIRRCVQGLLELSKLTHCSPRFPLIQVALWWSFYLFSVPATGAWLNWTVLGAAFLTGLFVPPGASVDVTEALSSRKYKAYADYQARVSRFVPWFPSSARPRPGTGVKES